MTAPDDPLAWADAQAAGDPVQARVLQALACRAAAQPHGALRERLVGLLEQHARQAAVPQPAPRSARAPGPLAELVAQLRQAHASPELRNVQAHRRTWSDLRLARRLAEVEAPVPETLGPLNSHVLVRRALQQLHTLSPDYLQRFIAQLDGLAALAPLQMAAEADAKPARKGTARRR
ncbi:DUF2894 domain-containing protein [Roseateles sp.]|uniref:DUF2894 domain-containing protein n=1 Tax=Roseateles sp. TaxID=1971397 RepID=UPI003BABBCAA